MAAFPDFIRLALNLIFLAHCHFFFFLHAGESHNSTEDHVREGVVVFMGALSAHMSPDDDRVLRVIDSLFGALATPSASVQKAVATCLPALMPAIKAAPDQYLKCVWPCGGCLRAPPFFGGGKWGRDRGWGWGSVVVCFLLGLYYYYWGGEVM